MSGGYDGAIRILTKIDESGFNSGTKSISNSFGRLMQSIKKIGTTLFKVFSTGALLAFGASLMQIVKSIRESMMTLFKASGPGVMSAVEDLKNGFSELQLAVANAFLPLMLAAIPYIKTVVSWLTEVFNKISMITAAFLGQKQVLQVIAGSAAALAKNTEKAKKSALGAMAAFDQINVLDIKSPEAAAPDLTAMTEMVPVTNEILAKVADIKQQFSDLWKIISDGWKNIFDDPNSFWNWKFDANKWFDDTFFKGQLAPWWKSITDDPNSFWNWSFDADAWFAENTGSWDASAWWNGIVSDPNSFWNWSWDADEWMNSLLTNVGDWWKKIVNDPDSFWNWKWDADTWLTESFGNISSWLSTNISTPIKDAFGIALDWVKDKWEGGMKGIINRIIDLLNGMLDGIASGINTLIDGVNLIGSILPGGITLSYISAPQIPHLAKGTVVPPNAAMLAVVGDNKRESEIISPVSLMKETFEDVLSKALTNQNITINFTGSAAEIVRLLKPAIDKENSRVGGSLIKSGSVI